MKFENIMMKRIPVWLLLFTILMALIFSVIFGWFVKRALHGDERLGDIASVVVSVADFPSLAKKSFIELSDQKSPLLIANRFPEINGFRKNGVLQQGASEDDGYLLLSSFDHEKRQSTVKLIRIRDEQIVHEWTPDISSLAEYQLKKSFLDADKMIPSRYQISHPLLLDDGSLVFKQTGPLFKISACSVIEWAVTDFFHHSIEMGSEGNLWVPSHDETSFYGKEELANYQGDAIAKVSVDGNLLYKKSVPQILEENGYRGLLFGAGPYENDVIHLNDIEPALYSTKYWNKGDLLVSMRNRSTVFLYRPSTNKIIWLKTGPWLNQHDADFVGQSKISVFGNDVIRSEGSKIIELGNKVYVFDFAGGVVSTPYSEPMNSMEVQTATGGLHRILDNGNVFIEETNHGRLMQIAHDKVIWQYTAKVDDATVGKLSWSRYLTLDQVRVVLPKLENLSCQ